MRATPGIARRWRAPGTEPADYRPLPHVTPPWADLDPDIVDVVRLLWRAGFWPTDSGDGHTKMERLGYDASDSLAYPHVFMVCERHRLVDEAERLHDLLARLGVNLDRTDFGPEGVHAVSIEASYNPADGVAVLMLCGVTNAVLAANAP